MRHPPILAALWLAAALYGPSASAQQTVSPAPAAPAASAPTVRVLIAPPLQAAQKALNDKQYDEARRQLDLVAAVPDRTPYETYLLERMRVIAAAGLQDAAALVQAIDAVLKTGLAEPELKLALMDEASNAAYGLKDYAAAADWARRYVDAGGPKTLTRLRLVQALYLQDRHDEAAKALDDLLARQRSAGETAGEQQLRLQGSIALKRNDEAGYVAALEQMAVRFPKPEIWGDLIARTARRPGFDDRLRIDLLRLGAAAQAWDRGGPYAELAERALAAGFATEAHQVLGAAAARGLIGPEERALQERAAKQSAADRAAAAPVDEKALAGKSGQAVFNAGYDLFTAGKMAEGLALMAQGVQRGVARNPDDAKLRLGAAYAQSGDAAKAREWLKPLADGGAGDGTAAIARLWLLRVGG